MRRVVRVLAGFALAVWLTLGGAPLRAEQINLNDIPKQWGMEKATQGKFWLDNPAKYAAAQQVNQEAVSTSWGKTMLIVLACGGVAAILIHRVRSSD